MKSTTVPESTKAPDAQGGDISLPMPDDIANQINSLITKYNGSKAASEGTVEYVVYKAKDKRYVYSREPQQPRKTGGVRRATLETLKHLDYAKYVDAIIGKSDAEKARIREENKHKIAA